MLRGLPWAYAYLDDILIASASKEDHLAHLWEVCARLAANGIVIRPAKCVLSAASLEFLGYHVDEQGIRLLEEKVKVVCQFPQPRMQRKLRQFLGMFNFYHRFILGCSHIFYPLNAMLSGPPKSNRRIVWTPNTEAAFLEIKDAIAEATLLVHSQVDALIHLPTDTSDLAIGAPYNRSVQFGYP